MTKTFGECPICSQGQLIAVESVLSEDLLLMCDDCESHGNLPQQLSLLIMLSAAMSASKRHRMKRSQQQAGLSMENDPLDIASLCLAVRARPGAVWDTRCSVRGHS